VLAREGMPAIVLPMVLFVLSAVVAFSTGSSWSTMTILLPIVVGLAYGLGEDSGIGGALLVVMSIGAVLEGAIFGDHCSPISDTTVLSSLGSQCDLLAHVTTQLPYALLVGIVSLLIGTIPGGFGVPPWISLLVGVAVLAVVLKALGRNAESGHVDG